MTNYFLHGEGIHTTEALTKDEKRELVYLHPKPNNIFAHFSLQKSVRLSDAKVVYTHYTPVFPVSRVSRYITLHLVSLL